ncbi:MAG: HD family phosphohydrolase [Thermodesulfobacteriota bacterium]
MSLYPESLKLMNKTKQKNKKKESALNSFLSTRPAVLWGILIVVTLTFTLVFYPGRDDLDFDYEIGDVANRNIKAPNDFFVEDKEATLQKKKQVKESVKMVYDWDSKLKDDILSRITQSFKIPRDLFDNKNPANFPTFESVLETKEEFEKELGITLSQGAYRILYNNRFSADTAEKIRTILSKILENGVVANKELLLQEDQAGIILQTIGTDEERHVTKLRQFYGTDQAQSMVRILGQPMLENVNYNLRNLVVDLSQRLVQPNITLNKNETEKRVNEAIAEIKPVLYKIKAGEMILREGEIVDPVKLVKLKALETKIKEKNLFMTSIGMALTTFFCLLVIYLLYLKDHKGLKKEHNKHMLFIASMLVISLLMARLATPIAESANPEFDFDITSISIFMGIPVPAAAMAICFFLGFDIALIFSIVVSLLAALIFSSSMQVFIFFFLSSITGSYWIKDCKERKDFITAGLKVGVFNLFIALSLSLYSVPQPKLIVLAKELTIAFSGGVLAGIIAAGLTPLIEVLFNYTTEIKLLEFSNLDQPVMRRLMIEAPGTYNHSVIVATLAEAAASEIGARGLKARVYGYYHDIGKLEKPQYFVENQMDGKNKHDKISPSMSALILIQHLKKGAELAKKHKLGPEIVDTIKQHHGTSLIKYFYNKSAQIKGKENIKEENFRYPGPKPQTREIGIVMLADVVEAATRAMEKPTPARIRGRVKELINDVFADGQLDDCELTLKDLNGIAKSFNKILTSIYHRRIEYTEKTKEKKNEKHNDKQSAVKEENKQGGDRAKDRTDLKRLGI